MEQVHGQEVFYPNRKLWQNKTVILSGRRVLTPAGFMQADEICMALFFGSIER